VPRLAVVLLDEEQRVQVPYGVSEGRRRDQIEQARAQRLGLSHDVSLGAALAQARGAFAQRGQLRCQGRGLGPPGQPVTEPLTFRQRRAYSGPRGVDLDLAGAGVQPAVAAREAQCQRAHARRGELDELGLARHGELAGPARLGGVVRIHLVGTPALREHPRGSAMVDDLADRDRLIPLEP